MHTRTRTHMQRFTHPAPAYPTPSQPIKRLLATQFPTMNMLETSSLHKGIAGSKHSFLSLRAGRDKLDLLAEVGRGAGVAGLGTQGRFARHCAVELLAVMVLPERAWHDVEQAWGGGERADGRGGAPKGAHTTLVSVRVMGPDPLRIRTSKLIHQAAPSCHSMGSPHAAQHRAGA